MKKIRILICIIFVISCLVYIGYAVKERLTADRNDPAISFDEEVFSVSLAEGEEGLLKGMTALDKEDGDITDELQVFSVSRFLDGGERVVKYIVFDSANNATTAERTVIYEDYAPPRIFSQEPFRATTDQTLEDGMEIALTAEDMIDGDVTDRIRATYHDFVVGAPGTYAMTYIVENSAGDSTEIEATLEVYNEADPQEAEKYFPQLSEYILYTKVGKKLDLASYLTGVASKAESYEFGEDGTISKDQIVISSSAVDYSKAGTYEVKYSYTAFNGVAATTRAYVVVEE